MNRGLNTIFFNGCIFARPSSDIELNIRVLEMRKQAPPTKAKMIQVLQDRYFPTIWVLSGFSPWFSKTHVSSPVHTRGRRGFVVWMALLEQGEGKDAVKGGYDKVVV
jgi:hypothetical protein